MGFLSEAEKARIAEAIRTAETRTSGELVTVIAGASDDYLYIPVLWAALIALAAPLVLWLTPLVMLPTHVYESQLGVFVVLGFLFQWNPLKMRLVPPAVKRRRAGRVAREQFFLQGLHLTQGRTGILIFVSVAERYVEIIADEGITSRVAAGVWDGTVHDFVGSVRRGEVAQGFLKAIESCAKILAQHAPRLEDDIDELPNHLIEI